MVKLSSHEQLQEQMTLPKEAHGISQDSGNNTALEVTVKFGQTSPPSQALATSPFTQDSRNQGAPEAMPKSEGMTSMAESLWTILQNKAAKVGDHESNTMQDSDTIMQQSDRANDTDCDTSASQLSKYGAKNLLLPPLAETLQRPSTPVRVSEPMNEAPETPKTGNVKPRHDPLHFYEQQISFVISHKKVPLRLPLHIANMIHGPALHTYTTQLHLTSLLQLNKLL
jgi:hypothetical protein